MAKLTVRELGVVVESIYKKVQVKKDAFKTTPEYAAIETAVKEEMRYGELLPLISDYQTLTRQINEISSRQQEIIRQLRAIRPNNVAIYTEDALNKALEQKIDVKVSETFPSKGDLEADIILLSIAGSSDIIASVLEKYGLTEEE